MSSEAKNLEAIANAIKQHNANCKEGGTAIEVLLNPFEVERLDWDEILGVPITGDPKVSTGRIVIVCDKEGSGLKEEVEEMEVIAPRETIYG